MLTNSYAAFAASSFYRSKVNGTEPTTADNDKKITQTEFVNARPNTVTREAATEMFTSLDTQKKGVLSRDQILTDLKKYVPITKQITNFSDTTLTTLLIRLKTMKDGTSTTKA